MDTKMVSRLILIVFLAVLSAQDIRSKKLDVRLILAGMAAGGLSGFLLARLSPAQMLLAVLPGVFLAALSRMSRGAVGMGDGLTLILIGLFVGVWEGMSIFLLALILSLIPAAVLFLRSKGAEGGEKRIPFVPFLEAAAVITAVTEFSATR